MNLGWAIGPLIGAIIIPLYGFQMLFSFGVIISLVCFVTRFLLLHEPSLAASERKNSVSPMFSRNVAYFVGGCSLFGLASGLFLPVMAPYAETVLRLTLVEIELMISIAQFAASFASLLGGAFVGKVGGKRSLATCFLCSSLAILIWTLSPTFVIAIVLMAFFSIFFYGFYETAYGTLVSSLTTSRNRATIFGISAIMIGLFTASGSAVGSFLWEIYAPMIPFLFTAVLALPSIVILLRVSQERKKLH
jgi:MFS family permease